MHSHTQAQETEKILQWAERYSTIFRALASDLQKKQRQDTAADLTRLRNILAIILKMLQKTAKRTDRNSTQICFLTEKILQDTRIWADKVAAIQCFLERISLANTPLSVQSRHTLSIYSSFVQSGTLAGAQKIQELK
ncbi:MAG: uncharacterized protein A8A55_0217 [Amphiamblys sp. WSBS2006]|nr:MAG: uncharacterized protein A8A55_0217 [Amphiamblys sp. WSBS2006]